MSFFETEAAATQEPPNRVMADSHAPLRQQILKGREGHMGHLRTCSKSQSPCGSRIGRRYPPIFAGLTEPVCRTRSVHFTTLDGATPNRAATLRQLSPAPPRALSGHSNRLSSSMLASTPVGKLNHIRPRMGIPLRCREKLSRSSAEGVAVAIRTKRIAVPETNYR